MARTPTVGRSAARNRSHRAQARSAPRATAATSFSVIPPCLRDLLGALRMTARLFRSLLHRRARRFLPGGLHDADFLPVADRIGRVGHDALVLAKPPSDLNLRPEVAQYLHLLERNAVVNRDR